MKTHVTRIRFLKGQAERGIFMAFFCFLIMGKSLALSGNYVINRIETGNELNQAWITDIGQDFLGFIWIGTSDGLYRYDGYEFKTYRSIAGKDSTLAGNNISDVFEDSERNLWVATTKGISLYDRSQDKFFSNPVWAHENYASIMEDQQGNILFGSYEGFFIVHNPDGNFLSYNQYTPPNDTINDNHQVFVTRNGLILVTSLYHINTFDIRSGSFTRKYRLPGFTGDGILSVIQDHKGTLWIGTRDYGLFCIDLENNEGLMHPEIQEDHYLINGTIVSLLESKDSILWIGTENHGLALLDLRHYYLGETDIISITSSDRDDDLSNNSIYSLFQDSQGSIWIGTYSGLDFYNPVNANFSHYRSGETAADLNNSIVNAFLEDRNFLWVATEGGINILNTLTDKFTYLIHNPLDKNSLSSDAVWAIRKDSKGNFWIGTWAGGLNKYNSQTGKISRLMTDGTRAAPSSNNIFSIVEDEKGYLWIGTMGGGLNRYNPEKGTFRYYVYESTNPVSILNNWVRTVFLDSRGRLWVSTQNSLELMDRETETFHHFLRDENDPKSISDNGSIVIFEDSESNIWFGTETGLNLYNEADSNFTIYREENGLPSNVINAIEEDQEGNLWLSTNRGISRFTAAIHRPEDPEFLNFDVKDGLQGNKFNRRSSLKTSGGEIFFGGKNGFNSFDPSGIIADTMIPPVIITDFLLFNRTALKPGDEDAYIDRNISEAGFVRLKYKYSVFTIKFAAINYIIPEKSQYKYILENFEEEWNMAGNRRTATYTNLDPGEYTFRVQASNSNGMWNEEGASIRIYIQPPWYRTYWAYFGYFLVISGITLLFRRFIVIRTGLQQQLSLQNMEKEKLAEINKMKTRFFTNISHEFRTPLTLILSPLESLLSDPSLNRKMSEHIKGIQKNARRLLRLINQLLDISAIEADHLKLKVSKGDIIGHIREIASLFRWPANQRNISYDFQSDADEYFCYFDGDKIEKICYNLISNAFKYTPNGGMIHIGLTTTGASLDKEHKGFIRIDIKDTGVGIKKEEQEKIFDHFYRSEISENMQKGGSGIGLGLVRGLVSAYRGKLLLESEEGKGTEFKVYLPVEKQYFSENEIDPTIRKDSHVTLDIYDLEHSLPESLSMNDNGRMLKEQAEGKPLMLIVEDNQELRVHLAEHFQHEFCVAEASNGRKALEFVHENIPDLIVSDIRMPEMDGIEFCKQLKNAEKTSHIPVILLTAKVKEIDRYEGLSIGADAYITKPFEVKILDATVKNLIGLRQQLKEKYSRSIKVEPTEISITSVDEKFLKKAISIVEKNIANPDYSVDTFSHDIGMSRSHLHRKFVGLTGHSPSGFIRTLRMKRAAQLLTKGQLTVSEILYEVGIKSRSYFTKSFKDQFGISPTEFVAKYKSENASPNISV